MKKSISRSKLVVVSVLVLFATIPLMASAVVTDPASGSLQTQYGPYGLEKVTYLHDGKADNILDATTPFSSAKGGTDPDNAKNPYLFSVDSIHYQDVLPDEKAGIGVYVKPWTTRTFDQATKTLTMSNDQLRVVVRYDENVANGIGMQIHETITNLSSARTLTEVDSYFGGFYPPTDTVRHHLGGGKFLNPESEPSVTTRWYGSDNESLLLVADMSPLMERNRYVNGITVSNYLSSRIPIPRMPFTLAPGQSVENTVGIYVGTGYPNNQKIGISSDIINLYRAYGQVVPSTFSWPDAQNPSQTDVRSMGTIFTANITSAQNNKVKNPRGWALTGGEPEDITTLAGLQNLSNQFMAYADRTIPVLQRNNSQGVLWWDEFGQEWPVYGGDTCRLQDRVPELLNTVDPATGTVDAVVNANHPTIARAFADKFTSAGFKFGVSLDALRQTLYIGSDGRHMAFADLANPDDVPALLSARVQCAKQQFGPATSIFYVDSFGGASDRENSARLSQLTVGNILLFESWNRYWLSALAYSSSAPLFTRQSHSPATPAWILAAYPNAVSTAYIDGWEGMSSYAKCTLVNGIINRNVIPIYPAWWSLGAAQLDSLNAVVASVRGGAPCPWVDPVTAAISTDATSSATTPSPTPNPTAITPSPTPSAVSTKATVVPPVDQIITPAPTDFPATKSGYVQQLTDQITSLKQQIQATPGATPTPATPKNTTPPTITPAPSNKAAFVEQIYNQLASLRVQLLQLMQEEVAAVSGTFH